MCPHSLDFYRRENMLGLFQTAERAFYQTPCTLQHRELRRRYHLQKIIIINFAFNKSEQMYQDPFARDSSCLYCTDGGLRQFYFTQYCMPSSLFIASSLSF